MLLTHRTHSSFHMPYQAPESGEARILVPIKIWLNTSLSGFQSPGMHYREHLNLGNSARVDQNRGVSEFTPGLGFSIAIGGAIIWVQINRFTRRVRSLCIVIDFGTPGHAHSMSCVCPLVSASLCMCHRRISLTQVDYPRGNPSISAAHLAITSLYS
jgi:hypothetical protein